MQPEEMEHLINTHIEAEARGDVPAAVAVYTHDVEHDVVGWPSGPMHGIAGAAEFYSHLIQDFKTEDMKVIRSYYGDDFAVIEHICTGSVPGNFLGVPGNGKQVSFRMLHVWEFRDDLISRENVWLDGAAIVHQLTQPAAAAAV